MNNLFIDILIKYILLIESVKSLSIHFEVKNLTISINMNEETGK